MAAAIDELGFLHGAVLSSVKVDLWLDYLVVQVQSQRLPRPEGLLHVEAIDFEIHVFEAPDLKDETAVDHSEGRVVLAGGQVM